MANEYCTRADLYRYGLPRGALVASARAVATSSASTETIELDGHGFETDDPVMFRAAEGGSLSAPLVAGTTYYAIRIDDASFKVAATPGGAALDLTTSGTSMVVLATLPVDAVIEFYSRWADGFMPAHAVPFTPGSIPVMVKGLVAELAAKKMLALTGQASESVNEAEIAAKAQFERFVKGLPLRDGSATAATNLAAVSATGEDSRGWGSGKIP